MTGCAGPQACLLALVVGAPLASASGTVRVETYEVRGQDAAELRAELDRRGPRVRGERYAGRTDWTVRWRFDLLPEGAVCRVAQPSVDLDVLHTLPRWRPPAAAARELVRRWERFQLNLREHENGHLEVGRAAAAELLAVLRQQDPAATCKAARERANRSAHDVVERHNLRDREYDERTGHGRTQGARFAAEEPAAELPPSR